MASADHEIHALAGAYVLDAVTDQERGSFAAHLAGCEQCREDVREMRETAARLGAAAAVRPRPELAEQTIAAARRTSQLAPASEQGQGTGAGPARRAVAAVGLAAAVLVLAAAVGLGVLANSTMRQLHRSQGQDRMIAAVLTAPDAVMRTAKVRTGGTATVVMSRRKRAVIFTAHGLRPLPAAESYELWLMSAAGDRPAGTLKMAPGGMAGPAVLSGVAAGDMIGLTVEPATGSPLPTSVPLVMIGPGSV
ncbi:MAG TPA: anti-sigma factor [Streptosporangiaceae bacterium]|nr:anti-sigma factor [Streptosporangiaceae bacterium]